MASTVTHFSRVRGGLVDSPGRQGIRPTISWRPRLCSLSPPNTAACACDKWLSEPQILLTQRANANNGISALPLPASSQMLMEKSLHFHHNPSPSSPSGKCCHMMALVPNLFTKSIHQCHVSRGTIAALWSCWWDED